MCVVWNEQMYARSAYIIPIEYTHHPRDSMGREQYLRFINTKHARVVLSVRALWCVRYKLPVFMCVSACLDIEMTF